MEIQSAFDLVADKVEKALAEQDYKRQNVDSQNDKEITALYTSEDTAYNIVYYKAKMRMVLRQCEMSGAEPDNNWKSVATWLFDPEVDTEKEADNIASDFIETIQGPKQQAITQTRKKKKKDNDGNVDSLFLANRMVNYFPELKEDIAYEKLHYANFRGITFAKEKILPLFKQYVANEGANNLGKLSKSLNDIYNMGDLDVKGIISYILFNSFYSSYFLMFSHFFVFYTFFIDDVGVKSNCTISSAFNIILRKRTTAKTENPVFLQWFFSCLNRFKSNARETWCVILVSES